MKLSYLPGCTLKTRASDLDMSTIAAMKALDIELEELPRWNCCGTVYSFADDDLIHQIAPVRNLVRAQEEGSDRLVTVCSFCYNTLKRASLLVKNDPEKLNTLNSFMDEEVDYRGDTRVVHLLELLRDDVGWGTIAARVKRPLTDLKVAAYYGCTLHRPSEAAIEPPHKPTALLELMEATGATAVDFPDMTTCCGSYQIVANPEVAKNRAREILASAKGSGAEILVVSCPLCECNLNQMQIDLIESEGFDPIPVVYFTQLLALALGTEPYLYQFESKKVDPRPILASKGLLPAATAR